MPGERITIRLEGDTADNGHVRLSDFIGQLSLIKDALRRTDYLVSGTEQPTVYYRIVDLRHSSPATMVIEAHSLSPDKDHGPAIVDKFINGLRLIGEQGAAPKDFDLEMLQTLKGLTKRLEKHLIAMNISNGGGYHVSVTKEFGARVDLIIGPDEIIEGSVSGTLELINIHNRANKFNIYPSVGPKKVVCHFPDDLLVLAITGINRYINVSGKLKYKKRDRYPYEIDVSHIDIYPPEDNLPKLSDLRGIAPRATGDMTSEDFVRSLRDAED